jgi:hypothetical protein
VSRNRVDDFGYEEFSGFSKTCKGKGLPVAPGHLFRAGRDPIEPLS